MRIDNKKKGLMAVEKNGNEKVPGYAESSGCAKGWGTLIFTKDKGRKCFLTSENKCGIEC